MKQLFLTAALMLGLYGGAQAAPAKLFASNLGNGIAPSNGLVGVSTATVRFGVFPDGYVFAGKTFAQLNTAFTEVAQSTAPLIVGGRRGFYDLELDYTTGAGLDGQRIYVWVLNGGTAATAPQQAIFSTAQRFVTPDGLFPNHSYVSPDTGALELVAHVGALAGGANIGGLAGAHTTAGENYRVTDAEASRSPADEILFQGSTVAFSVIADSSFAPTYQWRRNGTNVSGAINATLNLANVQPAQSGNYDCVVRDGTVTVISNPVSLSVFSAKPTFTEQPRADVVPIGATANLSARAIGSSVVTYQWRKATKVLSSANEPQYEIVGATKDDAGTYSCNAVNASGSTLSNTTEVVVLNTADQFVGGSAATSKSMSVVYYGKASGFRWKRNGAYIANSTKYAGVTTKTLMVKGLVAGDHGAVFTCEVTAGTGGSADTLESGDFNLSVFTGPPVFTVADSPIVFPDATIGENYAPYQIPGSNAASYTATGLPKGMVCNPNTGVISGIPTVRKPDPTVPFQVVVTITNGKLKVSRNATIVVKTIAEGVEGTYAATIARSVFGSYSHTNNLGGRVDMVVNSSGAVTGSVTFGSAARISFKGFLNNPGSTTPSGTILIRRPSINTIPLVFNFTLGVVGGNPANRTLTGTFTDNSLVPGQSAVRTTAVTGWKKHANPSLYAGTYNVAVTATGDSATRPKGASMMTLTIPADGSKVTLLGTTSDGQRLTGTTFVGGNGQVIIYNVLYDVSKGSILGNLLLNVGATAADDTVGGSLSWMRPANTSIGSRAYQSGFSLSGLTIAGGRYVLSGDRILNVSADTNAELEFSDAGLSTATPPSPARPDIIVSLRAANGVVVSGANPRATKLRVDAAKGTFSGTFSYEGAANRVVSFQGHVIRNGGTAGQWQGFGWFMLTQSPGAETDAVQSGLVTLSLP